MNESSIQQATVSFYDNYVPMIKAGEYRLTVSQTLSSPASVPADPYGGEVSQRFLVTGPRFNLPPADVQRIFPPPNASGCYDEYLPMVVFNQRALPWERALGLDPKSYPAADSYPWLALLVFTDQELPVPAGSAAGSPTRKATLPLTQVLAGQKPGPEAGVLGPSLVLEDDEDPTQIRCDVIDVAADTFVRLRPSVEDLRLLAHVRQVSTASKEPQTGPRPGWYSAVIANRFAVAPPSGSQFQTNVVHLVSLEGFANLFGPNASVPKGYNTVRLISLLSWTFTCRRDPQENFRKLMRDLIADTQGPDLLLRLPPPATAASDAEREARTRFAAGYVPLAYATRSGETTFSWYRGPFAPVASQTFLDTTGPAATDNPEAPLSASDAMIYNKETGLFDLSYAAAFEIGRLLALHSKPFSTNLLHWRRQAHGLVDLLLENMRSAALETKLTQAGLLDKNGNLTPAGVGGLAQLLDRNLVSDAFEQYLAGDFANDVARRIGKLGGFEPSQAPPASSPSLPPFKAASVPQLTQLMRVPEVVALLQELSGLQASGSNPSVEPEQIILPRQLVEWLARLALLYGVPLRYLVPDDRLLPAESIRFFYVDRNWTDSLLDGALSIALQSSRDSLFHRLMRDPLHRLVDGSLWQVREKLVAGSGGPPKPPGAMAGFLLRSAAVVGWPGLEVRAFANGQVIRPLRLERLSPSLMLGIYPEVPDRLELNEPSEGLVFGTEDEGISIRSLPGGGTVGDYVVTGQGQHITLSPKDFPYREGVGSPLRLAGTGGLADKLAGSFPGQKPSLGPAAFAIQMVRVPEQMVFQHTSKGSEPLKEATHDRQSAER